MEWRGLKLEIFSEVYEPAEDSFLLAKHAEIAAKKLHGNCQLLDMGCGCGIQALVCAKANPACKALGVDKNPAAVNNATLNAQKNGISNAEFLESDLFSNVRGKFDLMLFNPPYLPTAEGDKVRGNLNLAFDGGKSGREVTGKFLGSFAEFLKQDGVLLMVESSLAGIEKTIGELRKARFEAEVLEEEKFFFEKIAVLKAMRL